MPFQQVTYPRGQRSKGFVAGICTQYEQIPKKMPPKYLRGQLAQATAYLGLVEGARKQRNRSKARVRQI